MPRTPYATRIYDTPQKTARLPAGQVGYVVIHHAATTSFQAVIDLEMGAREVSSTCIVKDDQVASMFDEDYRAWSLSSQYWDSVSLSVETCNETTAPGWTISEASYRTLALIVADWCARYGIPCDRDHVIGHREVYQRFGASYATACPGGIDLDRVVADANNVQAGTVPGQPAEPPHQGEDDMAQKPKYIKWGTDDGLTWWAQYDTTSGFFVKWNGDVDDQIASALARQEDIPKDGATITESVAQVIEAACEAVRQHQ